MKKIARSAAEGLTFLVDLVTTYGFYETMGKLSAKMRNSGDYVGKQLTQDEITEYLKMMIYTIDEADMKLHTMTTTSISYEIAKR